MQGEWVVRRWLHGRGDRLRLIAALLAVVIPMATLTAAPGVAGAAGNQYWSIYPTSVTGQTARQYFQPILTPGATYQDSVTVANFSQASETFNLYAADAFNAAGGGAFSLKTEAAPKVGISAWVHLPVSSVTLAANSYEVVPFTIDTPAGATPGDHVGGIVLEPTSGSVAKNGSLKVTILNAVGVRIYGRVQGKLTKSLSITQLSIAAHTNLASLVGGGTTSTVTLKVTNTGNVSTASTASVSVSPLFGSSTSKTITLPQLLPQNSATFVVPFASMVPFGKLATTVKLTAPGVSTSGSAFTLVIPWLLVLVIVLIVAALLWRRHRRKVQSAASAASASTPAG